MNREVLAVFLFVTSPALLGCPIATFHDRIVYGVEVTGLNVINPTGACLNDEGWLVGGVFADQSVRAAAWIDQTLYVLRRADENYSIALGVNNQGWIVGQRASNMPRAAAWFGDALFGISSSSTTPSISILAAYAINEHGEIVGDALLNVEEGEAAHHLAFYSPNTGDYGSLGAIDDSFSFAFDINERRQIVGSSGIDRDLPNQTAVLWNDGQIVPLGNLGGDRASAYAINNLGDIVGESNLESGIYNELHAVLWRDGMVEDLGTLDGDRSAAYDINDHGTIVGWAETDTGNRRAVVWRWIPVLREYAISDLNRLMEKGVPSIELLEAVGINNRGQIVARATIGSIEQYVILNPIANKASS